MLYLDFDGVAGTQYESFREPSVELKFCPSFCLQFVPVDGSKVKLSD